MKEKSQPRIVKYPQNRDIRKQLEQGDVITIAGYAGLKPGTIRDMMNGHRRITDKVARAIIRLMKERQELQRGLDEIAKQ